MIRDRPYKAQEYGPCLIRTGIHSMRRLAGVGRERIHGPLHQSLCRARLNTRGTCMRPGRRQRNLLAR